jgi:glycosyltransferase involved in cell wall biosynthesis
VTRTRPVVAVVTDAVFPYHRGGKEMRYHEVVRRLARDAEVHVWTMRWWSGPRTRVVDGVTYHALCRPVPLYAGERRSLWQAVRFGLVCGRLAWARFDVIEADHIPYLPLFMLRLVCWLRRRPLVVTWHEVWGPVAWREYLGRRLGRAAWCFERSSMLLPDRIVAASDQTAERLASYVRSGTPVDVAPNGLDLDLIARVPAATDRSDLVFVGRLLPHKNVDVVVRAVARLAAGGIRLTCRVVGTGPCLEPLRSLVGELGVADLVELCDDVADAEGLIALLKAADLFVFPSVREGFGIAVLEALACGLPVVTSNHPDNLSRLLVSETGRGRVCDPTPEAVADAICAVRIDPSMQPVGRSVDGPAARWDDRWLEQFDWERVADVVASALGVARG